MRHVIGTKLVSFLHHMPTPSHLYREKMAIHSGPVGSYEGQKRRSEAQPSTPE